jgi:hypothetical protein
MKSNIRVIIAAVLLAALLFAKLYKATPHGNSPTVKTQTQERDVNPSSPETPAVPGASVGEHQTVIDPDAHLIFTKHARCRMDCRHISEADIREVLREGHINEAKSQQNQTPCPTYAIEDNRNSDGIRLRIVFAKCENEVKVVTCIDRDDEFACDCK